MNQPYTLRLSSWTRLVALALLLGVGVLASLGLASRPAHAQPAATLTVTDCSGETGPGQIGTVISSASAGDTIMFSCSGTIPIGGILVISTNNLTLDGNGQSVTLDGGNSVQVLSVNSGVQFTLNALTIAHGSNRGGGGAISNEGTVTISNSTFANNSVGSSLGGEGGAISNEGTMTISNSTFANNSAGSSSFGGEGGAISNGGTMTISNSTFANNSASCSGSFGGEGGAISNGGTMTISNSTFANNSVSCSGSSGGEGGAIYNGGTVTITGSIVAENTAARDNDCAGIPLTDNGYNLESGTDCGLTGTGSKQNTNPLLDSNGLQNNGGPTQTIALEQGSPAIDQVPLSANICPTTDQRGDPRPDVSAQTACDMGAYESLDSDLALTNMPANITTKATSPSGAVVTYSPTVVDEDSPLPPVSCTPASGSTFAVGKTTVTCTATDSSDSKSPVSQSFTVTVKPVLTLKVPTTIKTSEGAVFSGTVATGVAYGTVNPLTATISWGDGSTPEVISLTPAADGSYSVSASHSYAEEGPFSLTVTVGDHSKLSATRTTTVKVADAALKITQSSKTISGLSVTWTSIFTDADPNGTLSDYSASITWGDGNTTPATVGTNSSGGFTTQGSHSYAGHGSYTVTLTISDSGGRTVSKTITLTI